MRLGRFFPVLSLFLLLVWLTGCAFGDVTVKLPTGVANTSSWTGSERVRLYVAPVTDKRPFTNRIGMKKNGYGMDTANVIANQIVPEWLMSRLGDELRAVGFAVTDNASERKEVTVTTDLRMFFVEPVVQFWTVDKEADISLKVHVKREDGLEAERSYYIKRTLAEAFPSEDGFSVILKDSINSAMVRIVNDLIELFRRYKT